MPTKIVTETQLLRMLSNTPLQIEVDWIHMASHESKNISQEHLLAFYKTFDEIKENRYDGLIITGAPVERLEFEDVDYWQEMEKILECQKDMYLVHFLFVGHRKQHFIIFMELKNMS